MSTTRKPRSQAISIHALREEGDRPRYPRSGASRYFYPRPPRGGRLSSHHAVAVSESISIHALREEGDQVRTAILDGMIQFLSTPSARRATPSAPISVSETAKFLSTPSARRATQRPSTRQPAAQNFYPRPPRGGRPEERRRGIDQGAISIHALREEGDACG